MTNMLKLWLHDYLMYLFKHEMHMLLLLDMHIWMPGPCMGSWQCMYQSNIYIDVSRPVLCLC